MCGMHAMPMEAGRAAYPKGKRVLHESGCAAARGRAAASTGRREIPKLRAYGSVLVLLLLLLRRLRLGHKEGLRLRKVGK